MIGMHHRQLKHRTGADHDLSITDHVLGRPSLRFRKVQVFAVVSFWSFYLLKSVWHRKPKLVFAHTSQGRQAWSTCPPQALSFVVKTLHALAIAPPYLSLPLCGAEFLK